MMSREAEFAATNTTETLRPITRAVISAVGFGDAASALGQMVADLDALCAQWLTPTAPLRTHLLDPAASAADGAGNLAGLAQELATLANHHALRRAGMQAREENRIDLWLVLDLTGLEAALPPPTPTPLPQPSRWLRDDPDALIDTYCVSPDPALEKWLTQTVIQARARLYTATRIHFTGRLVILCQPAQQPLAAGWARALQPLGWQSIDLAGPVDEGYLCRDDWRQAALQALAALLWGDLTDAQAVDEPAQPGLWVRALGAAWWPSSRPALRRWVAAAWVNAWLARLGYHGAEDAQPPKPESPALPIEDWAQQLGGCVPLPLSRAQVAWPEQTGLAQWSTRLQRQIEAHATGRASAQARARTAWVENQHMGLQAELTAWQARFLDPHEGLPHLGSYRALLSALAGRTAVARSLVARQRESLAQQDAALQDDIARAIAGLDTQSAAWSSRLLHRLLGGWLPFGQRAALLRAGQTLTNALVEAQQLAWRRANWDGIEQLLTAHMAAIQSEQSVIDARWAQLGQVATAARRDLQHAVAALGAPWTEERLRQFAQPWLAENSPLWAVGFAWLADHPLPIWDGLDADALYAALQQSAVACLDAVAAWTPAAALAAALPDETARRAWLADWIASARPLWPRQELNADPLTERWLLTPQPMDAAGEGATAWEMDAASWPGAAQETHNQAVAMMYQVVTQILTAHPPDKGAHKLDPRLAACLEDAQRWWVGTAPGEGLLCLRRSLVNLAAPG